MKAKLGYIHVLSRLVMHSLGIRHTIYLQRRFILLHTYTKLQPSDKESMSYEFLLNCINVGGYTGSSAHRRNYILGP